MSTEGSAGLKGQQGQMKVIALHLVSECRVPHSSSSHLEPQFFLYFRNGQAKDTRKQQIKNGYQDGW